MHLPNNFRNKLRKSYEEQIVNYKLLYKCMNCNGIGYLTEDKGYVNGRMEKELYECEKCYGIGKLYFFELVMYPKYFDQEDFYL